MQLFVINLRILSDMLVGARVKNIVAADTKEARKKFKKWLNEKVKESIKIEDCD